VRSDSAKFFGYFLPKKVTTRTTRAQTLHSVCVTAWAVTPQDWTSRAGRESRATCVAPDSCPAVFCPRRYTKGTKEECVAMEVVAVGTSLRHVLSACGVETLQDKRVKDDFSIHVLKDVAISSALRITIVLHGHAEPCFPKAKHPEQQPSNSAVTAYEHDGVP
jgi:hypothetical protein